MSLGDDIRRAGLRSARLDAFTRLQSAFDAYRADPGDRAAAFGAMRALVRLCRLHDMSADHAALLAELARVDDDAPASWQLTLARRKPTRPMQDRARRERERDVVAHREARRWSRFAAVLARIEQGDRLDAAFSAVAKAEGMIGAGTIRQDYLPIAAQYRAAGLDHVPFKTADRLVKLPRPGRPRKKG